MQLLICVGCGDKQVKDVRAELDQLFNAKELKADSCGLCHRILIQDANFTTTKGINDVSKAPFVGSSSKVDRVTLYDQEKTLATTGTAFTAGERSEYLSESWVNCDLKECSTDKSREPKGIKTSVTEDRFKMEDLLEPSLLLMLHKESDFNKLLLCKFCRAPYQPKGLGVFRLVKHLATHQDQPFIDKPWKCPKCGLKVSKQCRLVHHMETCRRNTKAFCCPLCGKSYAFLGSLKFHMKSHKFPAKPRVVKRNSAKGIPQDKSGKNPSSSIHTQNVKISGTSNHYVERKHKGLSISQYRKKITAETLKRENNSLDSHISIHKLYRCNKCGFSSKRRTKLKLHIETAHSKPKTHPCDVCGRMFASQGNLLKHKVIHTVRIIANKHPDTNDTYMDKNQTSQTAMLEKAHETTAVETQAIPTKSLSESKEIEDKEFAYICLHCTNSYTTADDFRKHLETQHHVEKTHNDNQNEQIVSEEPQMKRNDTALSKSVGERDQTMGSIHKNNPAEPTTYMASLLVSGVKEMVHEDSDLNNSIICNICKESFQCTEEAIQQFLDHIKSHAGQPVIIRTPYQCAKCEEHFPSMAMLTLHIESVHHINVHEQDEKVQQNRTLAVVATGTSKQDENSSLHDRGSTLSIPSECKLEEPPATITISEADIQNVNQVAGSQMIQGASGVDDEKDSATSEVLSKNPQRIPRYRNDELANSLAPEVLDAVHQDCDLVKLIICKYCQQPFKNVGMGISFFVRHLSIHTGQPPISKPYVCHKCSLDFKQNCELKLHKERFHGKVDKYRCDECDKTYALLNSLKGHKRKVHQENRRVCDQCGKSVSLKHLATHLKAHAGEYPFKCEVQFCQFKTTSAHNLRLHQKRIHIDTNESNVCRFCGLSFSAKGILTRHENKHTDNQEVVPKRFQCEECGFSTDVAFQLKLHHRLHTGEFPYQCTECDKRYATAARCRRHIASCRKRKGIAVEDFKSIKPLVIQSVMNRIKNRGSTSSNINVDEQKEDFTTTVHPVSTTQTLPANVVIQPLTTTTQTLPVNVPQPPASSQTTPLNVPVVLSMGLRPPPSLQPAPVIPPILEGLALGVNTDRTSVEVATSIENLQYLSN